jgi:hypothetical protein
VVPQISDFTPQDAPNGFAFIYQFGDNANGYTWRDGTPTSAVTNTTTGVWAYGTPLVGSGFKFTAPADTGTRTLNVYVGSFKARGRLEAFLSDGSARGYTNSSLFNMDNGPSGVYTLTYSAASAGQQLIVRWVLQMPAGPDGNVTLQAAALTSSTANNPPFVTLTNPVNNASLPAGDVTLEAAATDLDGSVAMVEFFQGDTKLGEDNLTPFQFTWNNVTPGLYQLTARVTDNEGASSVSSPVELFVYGTGGSLTGTRTLPPGLPAKVNLTAEGTRDWIHWGLSTNSSVNRKAGVTPQLSEFTKIGSNTVERYADNYTAFSWTDGTPTNSSDGTTTGVFTYGLEEGFELSAPADTSSRTLRVYVGLFAAQGRFQAWLTDFSTPPYTDVSFSSLGNGYAVYQLTYKAASAGQKLMVRYRSGSLRDLDFGNVTLQAATLVASGGGDPTPVTLFDVNRVGGVFRFSFAAEADRNYAVEFTDSVLTGQWGNFTNLTGAGMNAVISDPTSAGQAQRFFRVRIP